MPEHNVAIDQPMQALGEYLRDWLNTEYAKQYPPAEGQTAPLIVKGLRTYDAYNVSYDQYPLLKCYRMFEDCALGNDKDSVVGVITYGLVYPELEGLAPMLVWVRKEISKALQVKHVEKRGCPPVFNTNRFRAEYRTMLNELTQKVHSFLRMTITFVDY